MPLYRYLADISSRTLMRKPAMIYIRANQYQLYIIDIVDMITDDTPRPPGINDQIQFQLFMIMKRKGKFILDAGKNGKAIILRERSDFTDDVGSHKQQAI